MNSAAKHPMGAEQHDSVKWRFLFGFARRTHLRALVPAVCFSAASGGITPVMTIFVGKFFNEFADYSADKVTPADLMQRASLCLHAFLILGASTIVFQGAAYACWTVFGEMQAKRVREELFQGLLRRDIEWFEMRERGVGSLLSRLQTYLRELQIATSLPMGSALSCVIEGLASLIVALHYSWKLTLVVIAAIPFIALTIHLLSRHIKIQVAGENTALSDASKISNNAVTHISLIKCFNTQNNQLHQYLHSIRMAGKLYIKQVRLLSFQVGLVKFLTMAIFVVGFWYGNVLIHNRSLVVGQVVTTFWSTLAAVQAFQALLPSLIVFEKGRAAAGELLAVISQVNREEEAVQQEDVLYPDFCDGDIQVSEVSFAYPARPEHSVLQHCSFHILAKTTSFIVGESGSGKSTIGDLILGFYPTGNGKISIDGHDIRCLDQRFLRNNITFVQQMSVLFNETLLKNIDPGNEDINQMDSPRIKQCIHVTGLSPTVSGMPEGLMTRVGSGGLALSGGQKQRVALGRAFMRETPILILDEPTSALDNISKVAVMENIRAWRKDMTTVVITHDMSLIRSDDLVYVMKDGKVTAQDSWHNLSEEMSLFRDEDTYVRTSINFPFQLDGMTTYLHAHTSSKRTNNQTRTRHDSLEDHLEAASQTSESLDLQHSRITQRLSGLTSNQPFSLVGVDAFARPSVSDAIISFVSGESKRNSQLNRLSTLFKYPGLATTRSKQAIQQRDKPLPFPPMPETHGNNPDINHANSSIPSRERDRPSLPLTKILWTILPFLVYKERLKVIFGLVGTLIQGVVPACFAFILTDIFQTFYEDAWRDNALKYSGLLLAIAFGDGAVSFLTRYLLESSAQEWCNQVRSMAMRKILAQPRTWFDQDAHSSSYLTTALDRNAEDMRGLLGRFIPMLLFGFVMATGTVVWAIAVCWKLTLVVLGTVPIVYSLTRSFHLVTEHWEARGTTAAERIGDTFDETFTNIKTVRALTLESHFHRKYHISTNDAFSLGLRRGAYCGLLFGLSKSSLNFILALIFYYSAYLAKTGSFPTSQILHTLTLLIFGTAAMSSVVGLVPQLASVVNTSSRLIRLAQMQEHSHERDGYLKLSKDDPATLSGPIHFINTTFYYPTRPSVPALKQLNMCILPHQCTAVVGRSGSGKSTIASLLFGLYPPTSDHIASTPSDAADGPPSLTLSGQDIRTLELTTLREMVVLVPQTPVIFPTTVRENITYGLEPMCEHTRPCNVEQAAIQAGIHDFIMTLPDRYDTIIGDGGLGVSGGQAQRIVFARAIVRKPKILVLDEPTSALDPESAAIIRQSIESLLASNRRKTRAGLAGGMTVIIITHARDMMDFADNVIVMEAGSVVEEGKYDELIAKNGKLRELLGAEGHESHC